MIVSMIDKFGNSKVSQRERERWLRLHASDETLHRLTIQQEARDVDRWRERQERDAMNARRARAARRQRASISAS